MKTENTNNKEYQFAKLRYILSIVFGIYSIILGGVLGWLGLPAIFGLVSAIAGGITIPDINDYKNILLSAILNMIGVGLSAMFIIIYYN